MFVVFGCFLFVVFLFNGLICACHTCSKPGVRASTHPEAIEACGRVVFFSCFFWGKGFGIWISAFKNWVHVSCGFSGNKFWAAPSFPMFLALGKDFSYIRPLPKTSYIIKGSLEEILPSYEKLRSVSAHVPDAKRSRLTVACVGTLGAARLRRGCGAGAARLRCGFGAGPCRDWGIGFRWFFGVRSSIGECNYRLLDAFAGEFRGRGKESNARHIIGECNYKLLDALAGEFRGRVKRK